MAYAGQSIVNFIASLSPLYQSEEILGFLGARSLRDGTVIIPHPGDDREDEDALVIVWWQGDSSRTTEVLGSMMATNAVVDYVQFHSAGKDAAHATGLLAHLYDYFGNKTNASLYLPYLNDDLPLVAKILGMARRVGPKVALEILKKAAGL